MDFIHKVLEKAKDEGKLDPKFLPWDTAVLEVDNLPNEENIEHPLPGEAPLLEVDELPKEEKTGQLLPDQLLKLPGEMLIDAQRIVENIRLEVENKALCIIGIVSSLPNEGASTLTAMISHIAALGSNENAPIPPSAGLNRNGITINNRRANSGVLLIDAQSKNPSLHKIFEVPLEYGLSELQIDKEAALNSMIKTSPVSHVNLITHGAEKTDFLNRSNLSKLSALLAKLRNRYEIIFLDIPPLLDNPEAVSLSKLCDGVILVLRAGRTLAKDIEKSKSLLANADVNVLGGVLNNHKSLIPESISRWL